MAVVDPDLLGRIGLGCLTLALFVTAMAVMLRLGELWILVWILAFLGVTANGASFWIRRRDRRRLREDLERLAGEYER